MCLVAKSGEFLELRSRFRDSLLTKLGGGELALVVGLCLDLSLLLQTIHNVLITPSNLVRQTLDSAVFAARLQPQNAERIRDDHLLLTVVRGRNTLKELETLYRGGTAGGLVGQHATHRFEEDARRRTVMERPRLFGVNNVSFVEEVVVPQLVSEETTADVDLFAPDDDDLLTRESLFGDGRRQAT